MLKFIFSASHLLVTCFSASTALSLLIVFVFILIYTICKFIKILRLYKRIISLFFSMKEYCNSVLIWLFVGFGWLSALSFLSPKSLLSALLCSALSLILFHTFAFHKEWLTSGVPQVTAFGSVICKFSSLPVDNIRFTGHDSGIGLLFYQFFCFLWLQPKFSYRLL